jgi:thioredoxin reductase (NADPH)
VPRGTGDRRAAIVIVGRDAGIRKTRLPGVFAAGDVRRGAVKRVASAVGEGAITIPLVHRYLDGIAVPEAATR